MTLLYEDTHGAPAADERAPRRRIAMISVHTSPLATLGGRETGGMNVYVRELSRELGARGYDVDIFTRRTSPAAPETQPIGAERPRRAHRRRAGGADREGGDRRAPARVRDGVAAFAERDGVAYDMVHSHYWMSGAAGVALSERWRRAARRDVPHPRRSEEPRADHRARDAAADRRRAHDREGSRPHRRGERAREAPADALYGAEPERIAVVPCGVDLELFTPMDKEDARRRLEAQRHASASSSSSGASSR